VLNSEGIESQPVIVIELSGCEEASAALAPEKSLLFVSKHVTQPASGG